MTPFPLSPARQQTFEKALAFAREAFGPLAEAIDQEDRFPDDLWARLAAEGYLGLGIPEAYGGAGGDALDGALVCQALARACPAIGLSYGAHLGLCAHLVLSSGTEEQKRRYLPRLCSGEWVGALGLADPDASEPGASELAAGIGVTARREGEGFSLAGGPIVVTNGPVARLMVLHARTGPEAGDRGLSAFLVELPAPGAAASRRQGKLGMRGAPTGEVAFRDTPVPARSLLGGRDGGDEGSGSGLDLVRGLLGALAVGLSEECLAWGRARLKEPHPPAGARARLAELEATLYAARLAAYRAVVLAGRGQRVRKEALAALMLGSEASTRIADEVLGLHGLDGYGAGHAVQRLWRDARLGTIGAGTAESRRLLVARELLRELGGGQR